MTDSGIYKISFTSESGFYIGRAKNLRRRKYQHLNDLIKNKNKCYVLQKAFNKYGLENLLFEVLVTCPAEYCKKMEQWFLDNLNPTYNIRKRADGGSNKKLTETEVINLYDDFINKGTHAKNLIEKYKISSTTIERIISRKEYSEVNIPLEWIEKRNYSKNKLNRRATIAEDVARKIKYALSVDCSVRDISSCFKIDQRKISKIKASDSYSKLTPLQFKIPKIIRKTEKNNKPFKAISKDGNIKIYNATRDAEKDGFKRTGVMSVLHKKWTHHKDVVFEYIN